MRNLVAQTHRFVLVRQRLGAILLFPGEAQDLFLAQGRMFDVEVPQHNCMGSFPFYQHFLTEAFLQYGAPGSTAGNYRHTSGIVPTELMPFQRRKQNCLYMGEAEFALLAVDFLKQQWGTDSNQKKKNSCWSNFAVWTVPHNLSISSARAAGKICSDSLARTLVCSEGSTSDASAAEQEFLWSLPDQWCRLVQAPGQAAGPVSFRSQQR